VQLLDLVITGNSLLYYTQIHSLDAAGPVCSVVTRGGASFWPTVVDGV